MIERHKDKRELFTTEQIVEVLEVTGGVIVIAAQRLGVHRNSLSRWIKAETELQEAADSVVETLLDLSEANLIQELRKKERWATEFYLKTKGRSRGYGIHMEVTGARGGPVQTQAVPAIDFSKLTTEEIEEYVRITEKASVQPGGSETGAGEPQLA